MGFRVIADSNINSNELQVFLAGELEKSKHFLFLTATAGLKAMRLQHLKNKENVFSTDEYIRKLSVDISRSKTHFSATDQKYILSKVICYHFKDNEDRKNVFLNIKHDIFKLFSFLLFKEIDIKPETVKQIAEDFSPTDADFFDMYIIFKETLTDVISSEILNKRSREILGDDFIISEKNKDIDVYVKRLKQSISAVMSEIDVLFIDGFLFFDDIQEYLITTAVRQDKPVYFITKQDEFIYRDVFERLANKLGVEIETVFANKHESGQKTSIRFIKPFINREEELRYIIKSITKMLKDSYNGNLPDTIALLDDIAIVTTINKEKYGERLSTLLEEYGLFVFKGVFAPFSGVDTSLIANVYFSRDDFMETKICFADGAELSWNDKYAFFERCYDRIKVNGHTRPISSYPVGQFVLQLYNSVQHGMRIESFKEILYSNWRYNLGDAPVKWSNFISDFKYIEIWFEDNPDLEDWKKIIENLIDLKANIKDNPLYIYHPLTAVSEQSLVFFKELFNELWQMQESIKSTFGGFDKHLEVLKNIVMRADKLLSLDADELEFEQDIIRRLVAAASDVAGDSIVNNLDSGYFAENIKAMLIDYENEHAAESENKLSISIVNLENMRPFKYCFFPMCEADKYPRKYRTIYPYTRNMVRIMENDTYGIGGASNYFIDFDFYMKLENYFMKNVMDFTKEQLIITHTERENGVKNRLSVFVKDLAITFDENIFHEQKEENKYVSNINIPITFDKKSEYTLTELAIFKLCPKLYFHRETDDKSAFLSRLQLKFYAEAVMYCDLFRRFMNYNIEYKRVYNKNETSYIAVIQELHRITLQENRPYFSFMSNYEMEDISRNIYNKMLAYVENSKQYLKGNTYTIIPHSNKEYDGDGYKLTVEHDNRFVDYDLKKWRMSQNSAYLEFLVLKTADGKSELIHYADMIKALDRNDPYEDRVNLIARIIAKINIQFDSGRFANDGIKRTDELVAQVCGYDFSKAVPMNSGYCVYCRLNDICMGK